VMRKDSRHSLTVSHHCVLKYYFKTGRLKYCWQQHDAL